MAIGRRGGVCAAVVAVAVALSLAACSGQNDTNSSGAGSAGGGAGKAAQAPQRAGVPAEIPTALPALGRPPLTDRSIVYTATLAVRTRNVASAADRAESIASGAGGYVFSSDTGTASSGATTSATVVLKVPPRSFAATLRSLVALGTPLQRTQHADDVTDEVVDVAARVRSQQASVARVRALLAQARTVGEVVAVESELTKREADLESLQGRQRALDAQVAMSTVTLRLVSPDAAASPSSRPRGFLAGLHAGWDAFVGALQVGLTLLGALLPFAIGLGLVLLVAVPLRRLRGRRRAAAVSH